MLSKLIGYLQGTWRMVLSGVGNCAKCGCGSYTKSSEGGDYCECGHSYGDHW